MNYAIAIHGGAGTILRSTMTAEKEAAYTAALKASLEAGYAVLHKNGSALDAVEASVRVLEDSPLFNAGKGSVYNAIGKHEMDASIMNGKDLSAGAVSGVKNVRNPITLARTVMEKSEHVFMCGDGAEEFARHHNIVFAPDEYFDDAFRYAQWMQVKDTDTTQLDHTEKSQENTERKFGTVGAVALDVHGNIAAATSTGGMTNKKFGRIGDSPMIGAGTYADNNTCAISCTGHGEFFIRAVVAHDIAALMNYKGLSLREACEEVVMNKLVRMGGEGGLIAIDKHGNIELPFNSEGMYRAQKKSDGSEVIAIYK